MATDDPTSDGFQAGVPRHDRGRRARAIPRASAPLPDEARAVVERAAAPTSGGAYRTYDAGASAHAVAWYPVIVRPAPARGRALFWPAVRTAVPAGTSVLLAGSAVLLAGTLNALSLAGTALGSVLGAVVARTQYQLEREQQALHSLWLSSDLTRLLVGRYESLGDRVRSRPRWYVVPVEKLAFDEPGAEPVDVTTVHDAQRDSDHEVLGAWRRWNARAQRIGAVLVSLGIDPTTADAVTAERAYALYRLARFRRYLQHR